LVFSRKRRRRRRGKTNVATTIEKAVVVVVVVVVAVVEYGSARYAACKEAVREMYMTLVLIIMQE
jgi:hypothetical protein